MGQSSSVSSKTALPSTNLLIDASDSYVTDVKLRSTAIIPISEYIKKDKYSKNLNRLKQIKKNTGEGKSTNKDKLEPIKEEQKNNEKETRLEDKKKKTLDDAEQSTNIHIKRQEKQQFLESSYEDIPDNRKWVKVNFPSKNIKDKNRIDIKYLKNRKTQTRVTETKESSTEEIRQLYKNDVYPHVYKNRHKKKCEDELKQKKLPKQKPPEPLPIETNIIFSNTDINRDKLSKRPHIPEESTHQINKHNYHANHVKVIKNFKDTNLVVQTNVACVIHPGRKLNLYDASSSEEIDVKKTRKPCVKKYEPNPLYYKNDETKTEKNKYASSQNTSNTIVPRKVENIDKAVEEHRKCLSAKQALENWKNIHTLKQYRKSHYTQIPEENHKINHRNLYNNNRNYREYSRHRNVHMEFIPPKQNRSRAGSREAEQMEHKMTAMEISNYNYSKMIPNIKMEYISPQEIKEHNKTLKYQNIRENNNNYANSSSPKYEFIETSSYKKYPQQSRYHDNESPKFQEEVRTIMPPNIERYMRNNLASEISQRDRNMDRSTERIMKRNIERTFDRNMDRSRDQNMDRCMYREDFIVDMERCLQKHYKKASIFRKPQSPSSPRTTWVQDRYRRWHKVIME